MSHVAISARISSRIITAKPIEDLPERTGPARLDIFLRPAPQAGIDGAGHRELLPAPSQRLPRVSESVGPIHDVAVTFGGFHAGQHVGQDALDGDKDAKNRLARFGELVAEL